MKHITTNDLQKRISQVIKEVEGGEVYQVQRYSKAVAFLVSNEQFKELLHGQNCKACMEDLRKIAKKIEK